MKILREIDMNEKNRIMDIQKELADLHVMTTPVATITLEASKDGEVYEKYSDRSKSWVRNMYAMLIPNTLFCPMWTSGAYNTIKYADDGCCVKEINGTQRGNNGWAQFQNIYSESYFRGRVGQVDRGIVVGVGTTAEAYDSIVLSSICANGSAANQLNLS